VPWNQPVTSDETGQSSDRQLNTLYDTVSEPSDVAVPSTSSEESRTLPAQDLENFDKSSAENAPAGPSSVPFTAVGEVTVVEPGVSAAGQASYAGDPFYLPPASTSAGDQQQPESSRKRKLSESSPQVR
jgi:hypothetical protein